MNRAVPIAMGTAMIMAITLEIAVPNARAAIPKMGGSASGNHTWVVKKLPVLSLNAGMAFQTRNPPIEAISARTKMPARRVRLVKIRSPRRTEGPRTREADASGGFS